MESSTCSFDFAAPQYLESISDAAVLADQDGADSFFDTADSQSLKPPCTPIQEKISDKFYTPYEKLPSQIENEEIENNSKEKVSAENNADDENKENEEVTVKIIEGKTPKSNRKHKSILFDVTVHSHKKEKVKFEGIEIEVSTEKQHTMITRQDKLLNTPTLELRTRKIVRETLKRKASPIKKHEAPMTKRSAFQTEYVSLAAKVLQFQLGTPPRFKNKPVPLEDKENKPFHLKPTIPHSPNLVTKFRIRPIDNQYMDDEEQKHTFKASKLNMNIFKKPDNIDKPKPKPSTIPKPFNLAKGSKKEIQKEEIFQFKARPMPKWLKGSCDSLNSSTSSNHQGRKNQLYSIKNGRCLEDNAYSGMTTVTKTNITTKLKPFSFDERDKEILRRKAEKIKKIQESASIVPVFQATPVPSFISSSANNLSRASSTVSLASVKNGGKIFNESTPQFKAKFPSVLHQEPFVPQKSERPLIETTYIELNTEKRARERQEFENELKMKEKRMEDEKLKIMALLEKKEKHDIKEYRKTLVHKPQPAPHQRLQKKSIIITKENSK